MNVLKPLYDKLATLGTIYYEEAPKEATYPYMVFTLDVPLTEFKTQNGLLVVDIWHNKTQTNAYDIIEALRKAVWGGLDYYTYSDSDISLSVRQELNNTVRDPDSNLIRRNLRFQILFQED